MSEQTSDKKDRSRAIALARGLGIAATAVGVLAGCQGASSTASPTPTARHSTHAPAPSPSPTVNTQAYLAGYASEAAKYVIPRIGAGLTQMYPYAFQGKRSLVTRIIDVASACQTSRGTEFIDLAFLLPKGVPYDPKAVRRNLQQKGPQEIEDVDVELLPPQNQRPKRTSRSGSHS